MPFGGDSGDRVSAGVYISAHLCPGPGLGARHAAARLFGVKVLYHSSKLWQRADPVLWVGSQKADFIMPDATRHERRPLNQFANVSRRRVRNGYWQLLLNKRRRGGWKVIFEGEKFQNLCRPHKNSECHQKRTYWCVFLWVITYGHLQHIWLQFYLTVTDVWRLPIYHVRILSTVARSTRLTVSPAERILMRSLFHTLFFMSDNLNK